MLITPGILSVSDSLSNPLCSNALSVLVPQTAHDLWTWNNPGHCASLAHDVLIAPGIAGRPHTMSACLSYTVTATTENASLLPAACTAALATATEGRRAAQPGLGTLWPGDQGHGVVKAWHCSTQTCALRAVKKSFHGDSK